MLDNWSQLKVEQTTDSLRMIKYELRMKNLLKLYELGYYTDDEISSEIRKYFELIESDIR